MENKQQISKIVVDKGACIGAGTCVVLAPNAFELDSSGVAIVKIDAISHQTFEELLEAAKSCPTGAIKLFDENNKEIKL